MDKRKIFIHFDEENGCVLHRLFLPYAEVAKLTDDFEFTFGYEHPEGTLEQKLQEVCENDIFVFHRCLPDGLLDAIRKAKPEMIVICDMDDNWKLNDMHPAAGIYRKENTSDKILYHVKNSDYITCTTEYLANMIRPFNKNVYVFNNALNQEGQFVPHHIPSDRLRFGLIGGASHFKDYELLEGVVNQLPKDVLDKIQFVLCGFDKGHYRIYGEDGKIRLIEMPYEKNSWHNVEVMLTNNYSTITPEHRDFLLEHRYKVDYTTDEAYHRVWGKDIWTYASLYDQIDVLLVPLLDNDFSRCKSELKMVEASVMNKAVIVSDAAPYNNSCAINAIEKGGAINPEGNCILVNNNKGSKAWVKAIVKLTNDSDLRKMITDNLAKVCQQSKYNLHQVAQERLKMLQNI